MTKYKGYKIKQVPQFLNLLYFGKLRGMAAFGKIYLAERYYLEIKNKKISPETKAICEHEITHIRQIKKEGNLQFALKYWLLPSYRYYSELEAIRGYMKIAKSNRINFDINKKAKALSGLPYLYCISRDNAKQDLLKLWKAA